MTFDILLGYFGHHVVIGEVSRRRREREQQEEPRCTCTRYARASGSAGVCAARSSRYWHNTTVKLAWSLSCKAVLLGSH